MNTSVNTQNQPIDPLGSENHEEVETEEYNDYEEELTDDDLTDPEVDSNEVGKIVLDIVE